MLFKPSMANSQQVKLPLLMMIYLNKCDVTLNKSLMSNILLCGGCALNKGFADRFQTELNRMCLHNNQPPLNGISPYGPEALSVHPLRVGYTGENMKNRVLFTFLGNVPELTTRMNVFHAHYLVSWTLVRLKSHTSFPALRTRMKVALSATSSKGLPSFRLCFLRSALRRFFDERLQQMKHQVPP